MWYRFFSGFVIEWFHVCFMVNAMFYWLAFFLREQFMKDHDNKNYIEADRMGFEKWKSMSKQVKR